MFSPFAVKMLVALSMLPLCAQEAAITLDPAAYAEVLGQMRSGLPAGESPWAAVRSAPTPEERAVRLLLLLQEANPSCPPQGNEAAYAEVLRAVQRAFDGESEARARLLPALRGEQGVSGLRLPVDSALAEEWSMDKSPLLSR
ncbi:MAG: hypothetical protein ACI4P8_02520 [Akkermansia sp.]